MQEIAQTMEGAAAMCHFVEQIELETGTPEQHQKGQILSEVTDILARTLKKVDAE